MGQRTTRRNQGFGAFDPTGASSNCSPTFRAQPLRSNCANLARFAFLLHLLTALSVNRVMSAAGQSRYNGRKGGFGF